MSTGLHKDLAIGEIHRTHSLSYANTAARTGATGLTADDVGRDAIQTDDSTFWKLTNHSPVTWIQLGGGGSGESNTASNVGTAGVGVYKQKTGVDLEFKKINAGSSKISVTDDTGNDEVDIDVVPANINHGDLGSVTSDQHHAQLHASTHEPGGGDAMTVDAAAATGSLRTLGTGAQQACAGNDSRLSDARTPTSHATSHQNGGGDEISVAGLSGTLADPQTPSSHASSHQHGGADEVATATPAANAIPKADGSGKLNSWVDTTALTSTAPVDVTKAAAAVGVGTTAARHDHKHDVSTAAPGATGVATASGEGSATTLARSDHTHQSNTAPSDVTKAAAAIGTSGQPARADHKHDVTTATASAQVPGDSAAEGAATTLARSDHKHSLPAYGTGAGTICQGNDSRLSDARTPTSHATSHQSGGGDAIKLDDLAAPDDNTDLDATISAHGLLPKLGGGTTNFLRADGSWSAPPGASAHASTHVRGGSDEIDGDVLDIDFTPSNYTPSTTPAEVTHVDELSAHLAGIDDALAEQDIPVAQIRTTSGFGLNSSATEVGFEINEAETDATVLDVDLADNSIVIKEAGYYAIIYSISVTTNTADLSARAQPLKNGGSIWGVGDYISLHLPVTGQYMTGTKVVVDNFAANDIITLQAWASATTGVTLGYASLAIHAFTGAVGPQGPAGADGDITWEGDWSGATTYSTNQAVFHNGSSYVCILGHTNQEPPNATYWELLSRGIYWRGAWSGATAYNVGDAVSNDGASYVCISAHTNQEPPNAAYWGVLSEAATSVFGSEYGYSASEGESSTTSATYQQKLKHTTPSVPAGDYHIEWYCEVSQAQDDKIMQMRVQLDDTTEIGFAHVEARMKQGDGEWMMLSGSVEVTLTAATHDIDIDYLAGSDTAYIRRARVTIWRVS